jgi:tRNA nucleotidyltransferase (CCA-adding enzyme)
LKINGEDLVSIGIERGPAVGKILKELLDMVLEDPMLNTKEKLIERAKMLRNK